MEEANAKESESHPVLPVIDFKNALPMGKAGTKPESTSSSSTILSSSSKEIKADDDMATTGSPNNVTTDSTESLKHAGNTSGSNDYDEKTSNLDDDSKMDGNFHEGESSDKEEDADSSDYEFDYNSDIDIDYEDDPPNEGDNLELGASSSGNTQSNDAFTVSQSDLLGGNPEQAKMELFWKLMDMGFSRERTVEAVHEKAFTDLEAAAEYLLTTGNTEGYSVEKAAPQEHKYHSKPISATNQVQFNKAVSREANLLKSSLPHGIYVRAFEDRMDLLSVMIKGPQKTPYEDGVFFFDVQLSPSYPKAPPKFHYHSYADRMNPNLYEGGKVCVSLLGTWPGRSVENWDPSKSNLLQVLVSIQGLILVSEPYFNEPGYESQRGTEQGRKRSREYNERVLVNNLKSLTRVAEKPPSIFQNEVREHLTETTYAHVKRLELWIENCKKPSSNQCCTSDDSIPAASGEEKGTHSNKGPDKPDKPSTSRVAGGLSRFLNFASSDKSSAGPSSSAGAGATLWKGAIMPDFRLAPLSDYYCTQLKQHLKLFEKAVAKLTGRNDLMTHNKQADNLAEVEN